MINAISTSLDNRFGRIKGMVFQPTAKFNKAEITLPEWGAYLIVSAPYTWGNIFVGFVVGYQGVYNLHTVVSPDASASISGKVVTLNFLQNDDEEIDIYSLYSDKGDNFASCVFSSVN